MVVLIQIPPVIIECPETDCMNIVLYKYNEIKSLLHSHQVKLFCKLHDQLIEVATGKKAKASSKCKTLTDQTIQKQEFYLDFAKLGELISTDDSYKDLQYPQESLGVLSIITGNDKIPAFRSCTKTMALNQFRKQCSEGRMLDLVNPQTVQFDDTDHCKYAYRLIIFMMYHHLYRTSLRKLGLMWNSFISGNVINLDLESIYQSIYDFTKLVASKAIKNSKAKEHTSKLEERMELWNDGKINKLLKEGQNIQKKLLSSKSRSPEDNARIFSELMFKGKINAALKFLSEESDHGILLTNDEELDELKRKHPEPASITDNVLLEGPIDQFPESYFDSLDETVIKNAAKLTKGAAGLSHMDSEQYRQILVGSKFKKEGKDLREQIALLARKIATKVVDPLCLESYVACRLIPLNKNPGV